jgi:uncharacterized metal-binding protein
MDFAFSCTQCGVRGCERKDGPFPKDCITKEARNIGLDEEASKLYTEEPINAKLAVSSAEIEAAFYGKATRVEETIRLAQRIGARKIGIATCIGLLKEAGEFARLLTLNDLEPYGVACKAGAQDKTTIGVPEDQKRRPGQHESMCNPILQAMFLNREKTELNVLIGLCVGHDSLFYKYSEAPVTTLITKDRVLCHNSAGVLYQLDGFYRKLLEPLPQ